VLKSELDKELAKKLEAALPQPKIIIPQASTPVNVRTPEEIAEMRRIMDEVADKMNAPRTAPATVAEKSRKAPAAAAKPGATSPAGRLVVERPGRLSRAAHAYMEALKGERGRGYQAAAIGIPAAALAGLGYGAYRMASDDKTAAALSPKLMKFMEDLDANIRDRQRFLASTLPDDIDPSRFRSIKADSTIDAIEELLKQNPDVAEELRSSGILGSTFKPFPEVAEAASKRSRIAPLFGVAPTVAAPAAAAGAARVAPAAAASEAAHVAPPAVSRVKTPKVAPAAAAASYEELERFFDDFQNRSFEEILKAHPDIKKVYDVSPSRAMRMAREDPRVLDTVSGVMENALRSRPDIVDTLRKNPRIVKGLKSDPDLMKILSKNQYLADVFAEAPAAGKMSTTSGRLSRAAHAYMEAVKGKRGPGYQAAAIGIPSALLSAGLGYGAYRMAGGGDETAKTSMAYRGKTAGAVSDYLVGGVPGVYLGEKARRAGVYDQQEAALYPQLTGLAGLGIGTLGGAGLGALTGAIAGGAEGAAPGALIGGLGGALAGTLGGVGYGLYKKNKELDDLIAAREAASKQASVRDIRRIASLYKMAEDAINPARISAGPARMPDTIEADQSGPGATYKGLVPTDPRAVANFTRREAKAPMKREMDQYLDEPMMSESTDKVLANVFGHTDEAGAKISSAQEVSKVAAARALMRQLAESAGVDPVTFK